MITDHGVLSEAEVKGVKASLESHNPPIAWRFRDDIHSTRFVLDISVDDEASMKYDTLVSTIFDRFCARHQITPTRILGKRIVLLPQIGKNSRVQKYMYSPLGTHMTFIYYATTSDGGTAFADGETVMPDAGLSISFFGKIPYVYTYTQKTNFMIAIEVDYTV